MPAQWAEWAQDAAWDPRLLRQYRATFEGHDTDEAVAINATTINDPEQFAAAWRNRGGGGAGLWSASDGSEIASAPDSGWSFSKPITATSATFSGRVTANGLTSTSDVTAQTGDFSGRVEAAGITSESDVTASTGQFSGAISGASITVTGQVQGATGVFSGALSAASGSFSGAVTIDGLLTARGGAALGDANSDPQTIIGLSTFRNAAGVVQLYVDAGNNRVQVGSSTPLSGAAASILEVSAGRTFLASLSDLYALNLRYAAGMAGQVSLGASNAATPDLVISNTTPLQTARITHGGTLIVGTATAAVGTEKLLVRGGSRLETTGGGIIHQTNNTGIGVFGATPVAQQAGGSSTAGATWTATEQGMLNRAYSALRAFGWID